jgi:pimeloyl-ACP methyl ester carboxylesterase
VTDLLCLPGLGLEPSAWRGAVEMSATVRSLPAYGARPGWTDDLRPAVLGDQVAQRLSRRPVLLGHSASCQVVARAAVASPEQVRAVVLVGPTTDPRAASWRALAGRWLRTAVWERPWQVPFLVRSYARTGPVWMVRAMEAARHEDIRADLCRVSAPVLVVRGRHDRICPEDWAEELARTGPPGSAALTLPHGGHMVPLTHGPAVASAVLEWLDGLPRPL